MAGSANPAAEAYCESLNFNAMLAWQTRRFPEAIQGYEQAQSIAKALLAGDPGNLRKRYLYMTRHYRSRRTAQ
jgi:hypothetical protein